MIYSRINERKRFLWLVLFFFMIIVFVTCNHPASNNPIDVPLVAEISCYPGNEVIYYESYGMLSTTILAHSPEAEIGSFTISLIFENEILQYESILSDQALPTVTESRGKVKIEVSDTNLGPGDYLALCTVTWKAKITGITDIELEVNEMHTPGGSSLALPGNVQTTIKIVKQIGTIEFDSLNYIEEGSDFVTTVTMDSEDKIINNYDLDISYDPMKINILTAVGNNGITLGTDGFLDSVTVDNGNIHITGTSAAGSGPGTDLEFFTIHSTAIDSGRTVFGCWINKIVTSDDIYIKPGIRTNSISIFTDSNLPVVDARLDPANITVHYGDGFETKVMLDVQGYIIAAYGMDIYYDPNILELDLSQANGKGLEAGEDGFIAAFNTNDSGVIRVTGFKAMGVAPQMDLELLRIYWKAIGVTELSEINLDVRNLADASSLTIARVRSFNCKVVIE
ncbi:MAG: cohesin domain-containing protein [Candidatus Pacearchaeota archaeon]|nr:cohesin domain-containing protein [Candidatus Pacearchaeota archaeon]